MMSLGRVLQILLAIFLLSCLAADPALAKNKQEDAPLPKNEIKGKAPSNYLALSRLHLPVLVDKNRQYRSLDLEVWLEPKDEENLALARSAKKDIMAALKDDFSAYGWEAFDDPKKGPEIIKTLVNGTVQRVSGAKLHDVLIKNFVLH